jgi:Flp pilus assembly protein TadD
MNHFVLITLVLSVFAVSSFPALGGPEDEAAPASIADELSAIRSMQSRGEFDEALTKASRLVEEHPESLTAHMAYQDLRVAKGEGRAVQSEYSYEARRSGATADAIFLYGRLLEGKKAVATLERVFELDPAHFYTLCAIGAEYTAMGKYEEARRALEKAQRLKRASPIPVNALGWLSEATGDRDLAEQYYRAAIELAPGDALPRLNLGILLIGLERLLQAQMELEKAVELSPGDPMPLLGIGMVLASKKDYKGAVEYYRKAVELETNTAASLNLLANAYLGLEQYDLAEKAFGRALKLDSKNVTTLLNLGYLFLLKAEPETAMAWVQKALRMDSSSAEGHYFLGLCHEYSGKVRPAEKAYKKAADLDPESPD